MAGMRGTWRWLAAGIILALASLVPGGCSFSRRPPPDEARRAMIQAKGSDTMVNLVQALAEAFMTGNPMVVVAVTGGGSGTGIAALINGTADLAFSSRDMKPEERRMLEAAGRPVREYAVAQDGLTIIVNPRNRLEKVTLEQLRKIYTGEVTNWRDLGGGEGEILVLSREVASGTYVFFKEFVMQGDEYTPRALRMPSSQAIVEAVAQDEDAIGYVGMGYVSDRVKPVMVAADDRSEAVAPTEENAASGLYPIARPLYFYVAGEPGPAVEGFIRFALGPEGQKVVPSAGYIPIGSRGGEHR